MTSLDRETRERLAKLLGLLGSTFDGEALAAAKKAEEIRRSSGATWVELLLGEDARVATEAARMLLRENEELRAQIARLKAPLVPQPWADTNSYEDGAAGCLLWRDHLTDWEARFLESVLRRRTGRGLSEKQIRVLQTIGEKVDRAIRAAWSHRRGQAA